MDKRLLSKCIWFMQLTIINTEGQSPCVRSVNGGQIQFSKQNSLNAIQEFDYALGGGKLYNYSFTKNGKTKTRQGSKFANEIRYKLNLKTR